MFRVEFDEEKQLIKLFNSSEFDGNIVAPIKEEIPFKQKELYDKLHLNVLKQINECEDFIYTYASSEIKGILYDFDSLIGRSMGDVFPYMKDYLYSAFRKVYKTKDVHVLKFIFYENYQVVSAFLMKIFYLEGQILFSFENHTKDVTDEFLRDQEVNTLNKVVNDVQKVTAMSIYYKDSEGKYHWSDETYGIIDREPRVGD